MKKDEMNQAILPGKTHQYTPLDNHPESHYQTQGYGEVHLQGRRVSQEDGSLFVQLEAQVPLTPIQVGQRLWTSIKVVDEQIRIHSLENAGTTACIACIHQNHLITANLADTVLFAALYSLDGELLAVTRLTEHLHKASDLKEKMRIQDLGGRVFFGRVSGELAVARALGDHQYLNEQRNAGLVSSDAELGIYSLTDLQAALNPTKAPVGELKFIMTCDGFTEAADNLNLDHHKYLGDCLHSLNKGQSGKLQESALADELARRAITDGSGDNVSVSVLTYNPEIANTQFFAIFDGHGNQSVVNHVVNNFANSFKQQLALSEEVYQQQELSTDNNKEVFLRDNEFMVKTV